MPQILIQNMVGCARMEIQGLSGEDAKALQDAVTGGASAIGFRMIPSPTKGLWVLHRNGGLNKDELRRAVEAITGFAREREYHADTLVTPVYCRVSWSDRPLAA